MQQPQEQEDQLEAIENFAFLFEFASKFLDKTEDDCIRNKGSAWPEVESCSLKVCREVYMLHRRLAIGGLIQQRHDGDYYCNAVGDAVQNAIVLVFAFFEQGCVDSQKAVTALRAVLVPAPTDDFVCPHRQLL